MITKISLSDFKVKDKKIPLIDVRSPSEYQKGHMVGAFSLPLFSDEQRASIGTTYKKVGKKEAIEEGLKYVDLPTLVNDSKRFEKEKSIALYCARGGMRSQSVAWLFDLLGFDVYLIDGGYKAYRNWAIDQFTSSLSLRVLGGRTGSGKTQILKELKNREEPVIDLEKLASHKGSVFGGIYSLQPSQEHFENCLAEEIFSLSHTPYIWVEDESLFIGRIRIPHTFFAKMRNSDLYFLDNSFESRNERILQEYGNIEEEKLIEAIEAIRKRLGNQTTDLAISHIREKQVTDCSKILLLYYDKKYDQDLAKRDAKRVKRVKIEDSMVIENIAIHLQNLPTY